MRIFYIHLLISTFFLCFLVNSSVAQPRNENKREIRRLLKRGDRYYQAENYHRALEIYEKILSINPAQPTALYLAGINLLQISGGKKALEYLEKYGRGQKKVDKNYHYWLGRAYHLNREFDKAAQSYDKHSTEINKNDSRQEELRNLILQTEYGKAYINNQDLDFYAVSMGAPLNSTYSDHSPIFTKDRQTLIFTSRRTENKRGEEITPRGDAFENIYISRFVNGAWEKPTLADRSLYNRRQHTSNVQLFDQDNKMLIYKSVGYGSLFVTERQHDGWSKPKKYNKYLSTAQFEPNGFVVENQSVVYFSSGRESKDGNLDLFMSRRNEDNTWSAPVRLPDIINTAMDEDAPVLSADGFTLYFCSRGHDSMGGYDIFRSTFDATSGTWSKPLNLGYPFNSPADDIYFIPDSLNTIFHLASNREGTIGQEDLFVIKMHSNVLVKGRVTDKRTGEPLTGFTVKFVAQRKPERQETITTDSNGTYSASLRSNYYYNTEIRSDEGKVLLNEILEVSPAYVENTQLIENFQIDFTAEEIVVQRQRLRLENLNLIKIQYLPEDSLIISGKVNNTEGVVPDARVTIRKENSGDVLYETQTDAKGAYSFSFVSEKETDYIIEIHKSNYLLNSIAVLYNEKVNVIGNQPEQQSARINAIDVTTRLSEIKVGAKQVLGGVYFEFKSADLFSESYIALDKLVNFLEQHPNITLEVGGYTDDSGTEQKNKQLSLKRAQTVINYLQAKGISGQRLKAAGYGKSGPIVSNEFALNGRDVNRRVEIKILSN